MNQSRTGTSGAPLPNSMNASLSFSELQYVTDVPVYVTTNAMNLVAYMASVVVSIVIGFFGLGRDVEGDFKEVHDSLQTLITPVFWTYSMWILIFFFELIFIVAQSLTPLRKMSIVQDGIKYNFFIIHCFHVGWVVAYVFKSPLIATIFILSCVIFLYNLCNNIYTMSSGYEPAPGGGPAVHSASMDMSMEFIIFRFPFHLHLGWAVVMLLVNVSELGLYYEWSFQGALAFVSLGILWLLGTLSLFYPEYPNFTIPLALAWAAMGIWVELTPARPIVAEAFQYTTIQKIRAGAIVICMEHLVLSILRFLIHFSSFYYVEPRTDDGPQSQRRVIERHSF